MAHVAANLKDKLDSGEFAALLGETIGVKEKFEGNVVNGTIVGLEDGFVLIDVGLKSEGRVALHEFSKPGEDPEVKVGDSVEVFVERMENRNGESVLSRE